MNKLLFGTIHINYPFVDFSGLYKLTVIQEFSESINHSLLSSSSPS